MKLVTLNDFFFSLVHFICVFRGEMCLPEKVLRIFCKAFRKLCFPFMIVGRVVKSACEDGDRKITFVLVFYVQTLGPFP